MILTLNNATKRFGSETVFEHAAASFAPGQLVAVLGNNGAGKTTLLECLYGLHQLEEGAMHHDGNAFDPNDLKRRRRLFYLPESPPLQGSSSGLANISRLLHLWNADRAGIETEIMERLERFNVLDVAGKDTAKLSRGQKYKLALTAFLSLGCEVWLFDEPLASGMDSNGLEALKDECTKAVAAGGAVIYSTQLEEIARGFSTHLCRIDRNTLSIEPNHAAVP